MFVEKTDFGYCRLDRLEYVPAGMILIEGSIRCAQRRNPEQVWGLQVHLPERGFVPGVKHVPLIVADRIDGLRARRLQLDAEMKALLAEEKELLGVAFVNGAAVTLDQVKALSQAAKKETVQA